MPDLPARRTQPLLDGVIALCLGLLAIIPLNRIDHTLELPLAATGALLGAAGAWLQHRGARLMATRSRRRAVWLGIAALMFPLTLFLDRNPWRPSYWPTFPAGAVGAILALGSGRALMRTICGLRRPVRAE